MKKNIAVHFLAAGLLAAGLQLHTNAAEADAAQNSANTRRPLAGARGRMLEGGGAGGGPVLGVLTAEQRASMEQALQSQREKMRELNLKLRDARRDLMVSGLDGKFDEAAVRKQAMAVAEVESELSVLRARALSKIQPALTADQIEKIRNAAPARAGARALERPAAARRRAPLDSKRDENNLPAKP